MSNHTANGELDDYLEGLLHDAGVEIDVATVTAVASAAPVAAEADLRRPMTWHWRNRPCRPLQHRR